MCYVAVVVSHSVTPKRLLWLIDLTPWIKIVFSDALNSVDSIAWWVYLLLGLLSSTSDLLGLFGVVCTSWLAPGDHLVWIAMMIFIVQPRLISTWPKPLQGPPWATYSFAPLGLEFLARTLISTLFMCAVEPYSMDTPENGHLRYCRHFVWSQMHLTYVCAHAMKILKCGTPLYFVKWTGSPVPTVPEL